MYIEIKIGSMWDEHHTSVASLNIKILNDPANACSIGK